MRGVQYFGHLMQRSNSLEKTLMLGKIEGRRIRVPPFNTHTHMLLGGSQLSLWAKCTHTHTHTHTHA